MTVKVQSSNDVGVLKMAPLKKSASFTLGGAGGQTFGGTLENFGFITEG